MIVVADSGPLHYLILLEQVDLLRRFYGQVLVPEAVASELSATGAPGIVREWITRPPTWVDVRPVSSAAMSTIKNDLDLGEQAAIALAETVHAGRAQVWRRARLGECARPARATEKDELLSGRGARWVSLRALATKLIAKRDIAELMKKADEEKK